MTDPEPPPLKRGMFSTILRLMLIALLAVVLHQVFVRAESWIQQSEYGWAMPGLLVAVLMIYALLIAIPFVPGVEIGIAVLAAGGADMAPLVWLATASGLTLAHIVGRAVPLSWLHRFLMDLRLIKAARLIESFEALSPQKRTAYIHGLLPKRYCGCIVRYRYATLAVLINLPGNSVIGGGGGIALMSGLSGVFRTPLTVLTLLLATSPVPLVIWIFDWRLPLG